MIEVCETATFELLSEQLGEAAAQALVNEGRSVALQRAFGQCSRCDDHADRSLTNRLSAGARAWKPTCPKLPATLRTCDRHPHHDLVRQRDHLAGDGRTAPPDVNRSQQTRQRRPLSPFS